MPTVDPDRLVFVDESGLAPGGRLAYGYAPRGERCYEAAPLRPKGRVSLLGALSRAGGRILLRKGTVTAAVFEEFVQDHLVPQLEAGDIVIWDQARVHSARAEELVRGAGAEVKPQPRYSPEYNAAEPLWGKTKHYVKKARADTPLAMEEALVAAAAMITEEDVVGWIQHCGYPLNAPP